MVKYGKFLRENQKKEWSKDYFDYKSLKKIIKEITKSLEEKPLDINQEMQNEISVRIKDHSFNSSYSGFKKHNDSAFKNNSFPLVYEFLNNVDKQIRKFYLFHSKCERDLYKRINSNLHIKHNYQNIQLKDILSEIQILINISNFTLDICDYINLNVTALIKILKKFDKKFSLYFGKISGKYVLSRTENKNSDLNYILDFKIIDEVSAILDEISRELTYVIKNKKYMTSIDNNSFLSFPLEQNNTPLLENPIVPLNVHQLSHHKLKELEDNIVMIDESNISFRNKVKIWTVIIKSENQAIENKISHINKNVYTSFMSFNEENSMNKILLKQKTKGNFVYVSQIKFNIFITLIHTYLFNMSYTSIYPTLIKLLANFDKDPSFAGYFLAITPFCSYISKIFYKWLNNNPKYNRFHLSLLISEILFILTHVFFLMFSINHSIIYLVLSRSFLGLSNSKIVDRKYLIEFTYKYHSAKFSLFYYISGNLGFASGFLLSFLFENLDIDYQTGIFSLTLDRYNFSSYICLIISAFLTILTLFFTIDKKELKRVERIIDDQNDKKCNKTLIQALKERKLSKHEEDMILEIEKKLEDYNNASNFSDTNLVSRIIDKIEKDQNKLCSYIRSMFLYLCLLNFTSKIIIECLLLATPLYFYKNIESIYYQGYTSIVQSVGFLLSIFMLNSAIYLNYLLTTIMNRIMTRKLIFIVFLISISIIIIFLLQIFNNFWEQYVCYLILFPLISMIESCSNSLYTKIIPESFIIYCKNHEFYHNSIVTIGKIIGLVIIPITFILNEEMFLYFCYSLALILVFKCLLILLLKYSDIRVKAISRIIRKKKASSLHVD